MDEDRVGDAHEAGHRLLDEDSGDGILPGRTAVDHKLVRHRGLHCTLKLAFECPKQ